MTAANENVTENGLKSDEDYSAPWGLKLLVAGLGVAIVVMLGLIVWKVMAGDHKKATVVAGKQTAEQAPVKKTPNSSQYGDFEIKRPIGGELVSYSQQGSELVLHFRIADGSDVILAVDRVTGKESRLTISK